MDVTTIAVAIRSRGDDPNYTRMIPRSRKYNNHQLSKARGKVRRKVSNINRASVRKANVKHAVHSELFLLEENRTWRRTSFISILSSREFGKTVARRLCKVYLQRSVSPRDSNSARDGGIDLDYMRRTRRFAVSAAGASRL